jgi:glucose/arabinose dehydrogenase
VLVAGGHVVKTVLNVDVSHGSEQGLLGITFSSDGTKMYGDYTDPNGDSHVAEWTMEGDAPKPGTRRQLLFQKQPFANHNGGQVTIGPDNMLYIAFGDGGSGGDPQGNGQNLGTWLG